MTDMDGPVRVRAATADDAELIFSALAGIADAVGQRQKLRSTPDDLRRYGFGDASAFQALIAEADGCFAGCCVFFPSFSTWIGRPGVYVQDFFVVEGFRGRGVGERLLQRLAAIARERGGRYIRLSVDAQNSRAQAFYTRCGLRRSEAEHIHMARDADFDRLADADARE